MKLHSLLSLLFAALFFSHSAAAESTLAFNGAWIAEAPPSSKVMAAYMEIKNSGDKVTKIVSATSDDFKRISFHQTVNEGDMAKMEHMNTLTIPANDKLVLKAGSHHIMLFNPVKRLKAGDQAKLDLKLENGDIVSLTVPVKKQQMEQMDHSHHMHH